MPITGTFEADFSQFSSATQGAVKDLDALKGSASTATNAVTQLEKATTTHVGTVGTLRSAYQQFDGVLNSVGVRLGPQITALEDIGAAAGKTYSQLGLLGTAGLALGTFMAAWDVGRWVAQVTGADEAVANFTSRLMGWGDVAKQTAGAVQDSINLANQRYKEQGIVAHNAAEALALNTRWMKEHNAEAKKDADAAKAAAKENEKWAAAMEELMSAGVDWKDTLSKMNAEQVAGIRSALEAGVAQGVAATAFKATATQVAAVAASLAAEKKALDDATAARRVHDAEVLNSYNQQIRLIDELEKARSTHYGIDGQIESLRQLARAEEDLTAKVYLQIDSEKDRMKVIEANNKRQTEIELEITRLREQQVNINAASLLRAIDLQTQYNKAYGLDAKGAIELPQDAMEQYRRKVESINRTMNDGAEKTNALKLASQQLTDGFLKEAQAADVSTNAIANNATVKAAAASLYGLERGSAVNMGLYPGSVTPSYAYGGTAPPKEFQLRSSFRAAGGPVAGGDSYIVGERGPELFVPTASGNILPNVTAAGRPIQIIIQGSVLSTETQLAALVESAMVSVYRRGGNRLPV